MYNLKINLALLFFVIFSTGLILTSGSCSEKVVDSNPTVDTPRGPDDVEIPRMLVRPGLQDFVEPSFKPGDEVTAFQIGWKTPEPETIIGRIKGALSLLGDEEFNKYLEQQDGLLKEAVSGEEAGTWMRLGESPVLIKYDKQYNEIRIINEEREAQLDLSKSLGEKEMVQIAEKYLRQLAEKEAIDYRLYETAAMQLGYKMVGEGSINEPVKPGRVAEYRVTYRPRINGVEMANAGMRMGITLSGALANLRLGGAEPEGTWENGKLQSTIPNSRRKITLSTNGLMSRFYNNQLKEGEVEVAYSKVMYVVPPGKKEAVVEPQLIVSYSELRSIDNEAVVSRRKTLAYSLTNQDAPPLDFDPPAAQHEGTTPGRQ